MWQGRTTISAGFGIRHRPVATCSSGIVSCACLRDYLGGLGGGPVGRTVKREGNVPTQYDHGEGAGGLERGTFDAQQDFSFHGGASFISAYLRWLLHQCWSSRGRQSVYCESASRRYIHGQTDESNTFLAPYWPPRPPNEFRAGRTRLCAILSGCGPLKTIRDR